MHVALDTMVDTLKAAAESSRLRILALLSRGDLTVSDLTEILGQSQPRVSRHLKLLLEAGLIGREALSNAFHHAKAATIELLIEFRDEHFRLRVRRTHQPFRQLRGRWDRRLGLGADEGI